jgi:hypothetical protein
MAQHSVIGAGAMPQYEPDTFLALRRTMAAVRVFRPVPIVGSSHDQIDKNLALTEGHIAITLRICPFTRSSKSG